MDVVVTQEKLAAEDKIAPGTLWVYITLSMEPAYQLIRQQASPDLGCVSMKCPSGSVSVKDFFRRVTDPWSLTFVRQ